MGVNIWERFKRLLPDSSLSIVTVSAHNTDGTSTVSTYAGGSMRVLGTGVSVGQKAYVRDGAIIEEAPDLTHYEIQV